MMETITRRSLYSDPNVEAPDAPPGKKLIRITSQPVDVELLTSKRVEWEHAYCFHDPNELQIVATIALISDSKEHPEAPGAPSGLVLDYVSPYSDTADAAYFLHVYHYKPIGQ